MKVPAIGLVAVFAAGSTLAENVVTPASARESHDKQMTDRPVKGQTQTPFGFQLGVTTLSEAETRWQKAAVRQTGRGHLALGTGSGVDGGGSVAADRILLVDIADADFEGNQPVRFGFYDGVLYLVQARLRSMLRQNMDSSSKLDDDGIKKLEEKLRAKYGPPADTHKSIDPGRKPNIFVWKFGNDELVLNASQLSSALVLVNRPIAQKVDAYKKSLCAEKRAKGISCW
jgi:hypothetical protein